ncbi:MAG TPA: CRISPR-associated protein Csx3 [Cyanobacteria bacterium UBA8803]|nr:CRISPR-associated protein Csx3 [Cyanobacteria bacterium UBA9273]HBL62281.1 CRISPR-associated protein Csx3 [Cyanobacteria bacterium UBA8803]
MVACLNKPLQLTVTEVTGRNGTRYQCLEIDITVPQLEPAVLGKLDLPAELDQSRGLVLWGSAPIWLYSYLIKRCRALPWVGCYSVPLGSFVIVASRCKEMVPGDAFQLVNKSQCSAILIGGPPNSGKSVLCYALARTLKQEIADKNIFLQRAQWDGEGNWFAQMKNRPLAEELSKRSRAKGSEQFFLYHANAVSSMREGMELVLVDFGGMPKPKDVVLLHRCTHYIIISSKPEEIPKWHDFCGKRGGLKPLVVIHSVREKRLEVLPNQKFLEIVAGPWERGETLSIPDELLKAVLKLLTC